MVLSHVFQHVFFLGGLGKLLPTCLRVVVSMLPVSAAIGRFGQRPTSISVVHPYSQCITIRVRLTNLVPNLLERRKRWDPMDRVFGGVPSGPSKIKASCTAYGNFNEFHQ